MKKIIKNSILLMTMFSFFLMGSNLALARENISASPASSSRGTSVSAPISISHGSFSISSKNSVSSGNTNKANMMLLIPFSFGTALVTNITQTSATINDSINPGGATINVWFEDMNANVLPGSTITGITGNTSVALPSYVLNGLTPNTTYVYKAIATDGPNITTQSITFTTLGAIAIASANATNITQTTATLNGVVSPNGNTINAWYEDNNANILAGSTVTGITSVTQVTLPPFSLTGLTANTNYTYKLFITDGPNISSQNISFTTLNNIGGGCIGCGGSYIYPAITTVSASAVGTNTASINGLVNPNGVSADAYFEYGTSSTLATYTGTVHVNKGSGNAYVSFAKNISGLAPNTTYYFRAVAENSHGVRKGNIFSFTTNVLPTPPPNPTPTPTPDPIVINPVDNNTDITNPIQEENPVINPDNSVDQNNLGAASIFGSMSVLPSGVFGWLILILIILAIVIVGRKLFLKKRYQKTNDNIDIENLPR